MAIPQAIETTKTAISIKIFSKIWPSIGAAMTTNGAIMQWMTQVKDANVINLLFVDSDMSFSFPLFNSQKVWIESLTTLMVSGNVSYVVSA